MAAHPRPAGCSYQVALPGTFGPMYHAAFARMGVRQVTKSSVFVLSVATGEGIPEIAAMLHARGLVILDIRRLTEVAA
jgi:hypothetical protein